MSKLTKEEKAKVKSFIEFDANGVVSNQGTLENNLIDFMNKKYREKYKSDESYKHIKSMHNFINLDSTEVHCLIPEDNIYLERVSVLLYQESIKDRKSRGVRTKNESKNIEQIGTNDIGQKRQYEPYYQMNGQKIYLTFESSDNYSEESKTQWACEHKLAQEYSEVERSVDASINEIFERYYTSKQKNELLYKLLINFNKFGSFSWENHEALIFLINVELPKYKPTNNQISIINKIFAGKIPDANQKKSLKRMLRINDK